MLKIGVGSGAGINSLKISGFACRSEVYGEATRSLHSSTLADTKSSMLKKETKKEIDETIILCRILGLFLIIKSKLLAGTMSI
jgi:hypothetical protein